jgi:hypothetical protein
MGAAPGANGLDRELLAKVLGMLGSAHDGEALAAGRAADSLVRDAGTTWRSALNYEAIAEDAARILYAENEELHRQLSLCASQVDTLRRAQEKLHAPGILAALRRTAMMRPLDFVIVAFFVTAFAGILGLWDAMSAALRFR